MGTNRSRPDGEHNSRANVRLNRMRYRYSADIEAIQFTGDNHDEIKQFVSSTRRSSMFRIASWVARIRPSSTLRTDFDS